MFYKIELKNYSKYTHKIIKMIKSALQNFSYQKIFFWYSLIQNS